MRRTPLVAALVLSTGFLAARPAPPVLSRVAVVDADTGAPVAETVVMRDQEEIRPDADGRYPIARPAPDTIRVRAPGYLRQEVSGRLISGPLAEIRLKPFRPMAVYLSVYGAGNRALRHAALALAAATAINAIVVDVKGDGGIIPYRSAIPLAAAVGAQRAIMIGDLPSFVADLHERGLYAIARIAVFEDNFLALARPSSAVHTRDGSLFRDRQGLAWTDPFDATARAYNIDVAVEAARAGFDEIQFDYVRFPDAPGLSYQQPATASTSREAAIEEFFREARRTLAPYNVFVAADIFGYVCWNTDDTHIGQQIEHLAGLVDYLSPMLYPSGFQFGIPGYRHPVQHPYEIVSLSLREAGRRTHLAPVHFRPWLQAFRDYAFGGRAFGPAEVSAQIEAAEEFGADGWMLWNPRNVYAAADLTRR